ncbi:hypothetical protein INT45_014059, partial [Circinella minor]
MASFPWQQQQPYCYYSQQPHQQQQQQQQYPLLGGIRPKRLAPHELIKMLYEPILMEDSASNSSSSVESYTTSCCTTTSATTTTTTANTTDEVEQEGQEDIVNDSDYSLLSLRKHHHNNNNSNNNSSSQTSHASSNSSSGNKKRRSSYHLLLREIRRLRAENDGLRQMVDTVKQDLRFERESRQISERCHQKYYTESSDRQIELEVDVMDKEKEIEDLKERITELEYVTSPTTTTATSIHYNNNNHHSTSSRWGCFDFDMEDELFCQPIIGESATPDPLTRLSTQNASSSSEEEEESDDPYENDDDEKDDDDDTQGEFSHTLSNKSTDDEKFEQLATSYLHQAIISKLTSARANLELDDLMLKYDPSPAVVLRMLATSFVIWVKNVVSNDHDKNAVKALSTGVTEGFLGFWKAILEKHVHDDDDQCQFLNEAERILDKDEDDKKVEEDDVDMDSKQALVDNFHRLLVMLYKYDIVDGEAITRWWHSIVGEEENEEQGKKNDQIAFRLRGVTKAFTQWLNEDEESDDDDDDDDDDEDSIFIDEEIDEFDHSSEEEEEEEEGVVNSFDYDIGSDCDTVIDHPTLLTTRTTTTTLDEEEAKKINSILEEDRQYCACQFEDDDDNNCIINNNSKINYNKDVEQDVHHHNSNNNNNNNNTINKSNTNDNINNIHHTAHNNQQQEQSSELFLSSEVTP